LHCPLPIPIDLSFDGTPHSGMADARLQAI